VLVVLHHQPIPVGSAWLDSIRLMNGPEMLEVVSRHRNVRGILWGHVHQAFDGMHAGVAMMSTPSTCFQFVPGRDDFALDDRPPGYRWLHLYPDGRIDTRVVWVPAQ
jgi:Icc protein